MPFAIQLEELAQFLDRFFNIQQFEEDVGGVFQASDRPIRRLGLALERSPGLSQWVQHNQLDALFLHRPWHALEQLPSDLGIISYHLAFDQQLTVGFNLRLAESLNLSGLEALGHRPGRAIGMIGDVPLQSFERYCYQVEAVFGGYEDIQDGKRPISRVAVVGAMTDELVREAAVRGAQLYVTGQFRQPAMSAVMEIELGAIATGHRRAEEWGLRSLAHVLNERWATLETMYFLS
jgi:putative NIF3 family GTP cyclohydrolase 1 type 2